MIESAKSIMGRSLNAIDDRFGCCYDLYFDDATLGVIYMVADTRKWLAGRKTLLSPQVVESVSEDDINLKITRDLIESSPPIEADSPLSRKYESDLFTHYDWMPYWKLSGASSEAAFETTVRATGPGCDPDLKSARDLMGSKVNALGDRVGRVYDLLIDTHNWTVRYIAVDTHPWIPHSVHLIDALHLQTVDESSSSLVVRCLAETIKTGPLLNDVDLPCSPEKVENVVGKKKTAIA